VLKQATKLLGNGGAAIVLGASLATRSHQVEAWGLRREG